MTTQVISGLLVTSDDAKALALALDGYARLSWKHGRKLGLDLLQLRNKMAEYATCATTCANTSKDAATTVHVADSNDPIVPTAKAAEMLQTTQSNVRDLIDRKRLAALKSGNRWWISVPSIEDYKAERAL